MFFKPLGIIALYVSNKENEGSEKDACCQMLFISTILPGRRSGWLYQMKYTDSDSVCFELNFLWEEEEEEVVRFLCTDSDEYVLLVLTRS